MLQERKPEVIAVVGAQWGDEGKGKIVDYLAKDADLVIRAQGGDNAGHTVVNDLGHFALHLIPAGIFHPNVLNIIGAGVVLNPETLLKEIEVLSLKKIPVNNLRISSKAHLVFDYHIALDKWQENLRGSKKIGTTKQGIGPAYTDKIVRMGLRVGLLKDLDSFMRNLRVALLDKRTTLSLDTAGNEFRADYYEEFVRKASKLLSPIIVDTDQLIERYLAKGSRFIIEGAQGTLLDIDHGTYPKVTSSSTTVAGLLQGAGIAPRWLTKAIGVYKAYQTRVGEGAMPTELKNQKGDEIREKGQEKGTTTGRPRRIGFFDGVAARYAQHTNGFTHIALTRLDVLSGIGQLKVCNGYLKNDYFSDRFEPDDDILSQCIPVYHKTDVFKGYNFDFSSTRNFTYYPIEVKKYIQAIVDTIPGAKLSFLGIGPKREDILCV